MRVLQIFASFILSAVVVQDARGETLNLLIWESYIDPALIDRFTHDTGIIVHQTFYDSGDARDAILSDPGSNVDLVVIGENGSALYGKRGILEPLDDTKVPSLADYPTDWRNKCASFGLPYLWGTMGILYRADKVSPTPSSWNDLMRPAPALRKHIAMYEDHNEGFVAPLALLGKSINANDTETLKEAFELMKQQAPFVLTYDYVITSIQNPKYGADIYMALGYSGDQHVLNEKANAGGAWHYVVPREGTLAWLDCMAVSANSPRKAQALRFMDFIGSPKSAAANAVTLVMPVVNPKALPLVPAEMRENPEIYPPQEIIDKSQTQQELSVQSIQTRRRIISSMANYQ